MSFASEVKNELCRVPVSRHCCAVAEAYGVLLYCHTFTTREIRIVTACDAFAERLPKLFRRAFGAHFALPAGEKAGGRHVLTITDRAAVETVFAAFGADLSRTVAHHINLAVLENDCCKASFLRGAFLAGGSVTAPSKNYHLELITAHASVSRETAALLTELESRGEIDHAVGLANTEALDGYMLADKLTPRQFAELAGLDYEAAQVVYAAYAAQQSEYGKLAGNLATYKVPLIDMLLFVCEQIDAGVVTLSDDQTQMLQDAEVQMNSAKAQLQGTDYDRMLIYLTLPESSDETYAFTDKIAEKYYPDENVYLAGESTNEYEFEKSFAVDNKVVSIVSVLVVMLVLLFTFNSAGMPVLLILVIQGCIWLNFSFPTITGKYIFFLGYLIVSSIQMGANIDYAIVIASRYQELKSKMHHRDAIVETLNFAFPTIITSGSILSICGFLIGSMTSEPVIAGIGESLGRGTVISIIMVMFALPQILLIGSGIVDKTSFSVPSIAEKKSGHGKVSVNGMVRGNINGTVHGIMHATVEGDIDLNLISGSANEEQDDEED